MWLPRHGCSADAVKAIVPPAICTAFVFTGQMEAAAQHCARLALAAETATAQHHADTPPCHDSRPAAENSPPAEAAPRRPLRMHRRLKTCATLAATTTSQRIEPYAEPWPPRPPSTRPSPPPTGALHAPDLNLACGFRRILKRFQCQELPMTRLAMIASAILIAPSAMAQVTDHSAHEDHKPPAAQTPAKPADDHSDHAQLDHPQMDHGMMDHSAMDQATPHAMSSALGAYAATRDGSGTSWGPRRLRPQRPPPQPATGC